MLRFARDTIGLRRVVAITRPENARSIAVLETLGFSFEKMVRLTEDAAPVRLFGLAL